MRYLIAAVFIAATPSANAKQAGDGVSCRNTDVEISCDEDACTVADSHTPMDVTVKDGQIDACAYSGCWNGPAVTLHAGPFSIYTGTDMEFSAPTGNPADVSLTVNNDTGVATILVAGQFAQPALCEKH